MSETIEEALRELDDYADDVARASYQHIQNALARYVSRLDDGGPLQTSLDSVLPAVEFDPWWEAAEKTRGAIVGSGTLDWSTDAAERVALQRELIRRLADERIGLLHFALGFTYGGRRYDSTVSEFVTQVFRPFHRDLTRLLRRIRETTGSSKVVDRVIQDVLVTLKPPDELEDPVEITRGLGAFRADHGQQRCAFLIMQFGKSLVRHEIAETIQACLAPHGIKVVRADDKDYLEDLFANVSVYMHGSEFGIAVFDRVSEDDANPNVSLEVGYMLGMVRPVCLLKDKNLKTLPTDLTGRLYKEFDPERPSETIPPKLEKWLSDRDLV